jgi:hypothetical protein
MFKDNNLILILNNSKRSFNKKDLVIYLIIIILCNIIYKKEDIGIINLKYNNMIKKMIKIVNYYMIKQKMLIIK